MSVKDKTTSPDLAGHIGEVASNSKGYNTPLLPENQLHETGNWCKLIAVCREGALKESFSNVMRCSHE